MNPQFRIVEALGRGPLGTVYLAERTAGGAPERVALKLLEARFATPAAVERLEDAVLRASFIKDARIVRPSEVVRFDGATGVVSEHIEGVDLRRLMRLGQAPPGPAVDLVMSLAGALHSAMFQTGPDGEPIQAAHYDIRPQNVMLTRYGDVRVLDLGVFRAVTGGDVELARKLDPEQRLAPEAADGVMGSPADIYAVGLLLFELLAGRPFPRAGGDARTHKQSLASAISALQSQGVDPMATTVAEALLAWEPEVRPLARDVERLARDLRRSVGGATLREWAQQVVPMALDSGEPLRDVLVGSTLLAIAAPERPRQLRGGLPLPAPIRMSRAVELPEDEEVTVTVTSPARRPVLLQLHPPVEGDDFPTEFHTVEVELTEGLKAEIAAEAAARHAGLPVATPVLPAAPGGAPPPPPSVSAPPRPLVVQSSVPRPAPEPPRRAVVDPADAAAPTGDPHTNPRGGIPRPTVARPSGIPLSRGATPEAPKPVEVPKPVEAPKPVEVPKAVERPRAEPPKPVAPPEPPKEPEAPRRSPKLVIRRPPENLPPVQEPAAPEPQALPVQALPVQAPPVHAPPVQAPPVQAPPVAASAPPVTPQAPYPGAPPAQPGWPPGYPPQGAAFPQGYPPQGGVPGQQAWPPGYPPQGQPVWPPGYPPQGAPQQAWPPGYPQGAGQPAYPPQGSPFPTSPPPVAPSVPYTPAPGDPPGAVGPARVASPIELGLPEPEPVALPDSPREKIIMALPAGCFLLALIGIGAVYAYLYLR